MSPQGLCVSPAFHRQRYGTLSTLCRSKALSWVMDGSITVGRVTGCPTTNLRTGCSAQCRCRERYCFSCSHIQSVLVWQFMGLALKVSHAKLPGLYGSNQTIPHTRCEFSKGGKVVTIHNTKAH